MSVNIKRLAIILGALIFLVVVVLVVLKSGGTGSQTQSGSTFPIDDSGFPSETGTEQSGTGSTSGGTANNAENNNQVVGQVFPGAGSDGSTSTRVTAQVLKKIWDKPVVGATVYGSTKNASLTLRLMEEGTGYVYDYDMATGVNKRVSGTTIPKVKKVLWGNKGQSLIFQYMDKDNIVKTYSGRISTGTSSTSGLSGQFITADISDIAVGPRDFERTSCPPLLSLKLELGKSNNPDEVARLQRFLISQEIGQIGKVIETRIFDEQTKASVIAFQEKYKDDILTPNGLSTGNGIVGASTRQKINQLYCEKAGQTVTGARIVYVEKSDDNSLLGTSEFNNQAVNKLAFSKVGSLLVSWPEKNTILVSTKPDSQVQGNLFALPTKGSGSSSLADLATPVLKNVLGLTVNANTKADKIIYGEAGSSLYKTKMLDRRSGETRSFPLVTIPSEKCVWDQNLPYLVYCAGPRQGLGTNEPESWYLGFTKNQDSIYAIDTETDTVSTLYNSDTNTHDILNLQVSEDSSMLLFIDKKDSTLWALPLVER